MRTQAWILILIFQLLSNYQSTTVETPILMRVTNPCSCSTQETDETNCDETAEVLQRQPSVISYTLRVETV